MGLFGEKKKTPQEQVREWKRELRRQERALDRDIRGIEREEAKLKTSAKQAAKRGDISNAKALARELVHSHKAKERIYMSKAALRSAELSMTQAAAMAKVAGGIKKSTEVMAAMNRLISIPELNRTMAAMSSEMMKAGLIDEMVQDTMDDVLDEELESDEEEAVASVLAAIAEGRDPALKDKGKQRMEQLPSVPSDAEQEDSDEEVREMAKRLDALKG